jgi:hypothetical protein
MVEFLVIEATGEFVADDDTYARAADDWSTFSAMRLDQHGVQAMPDLDGRPGYTVYFDDAGFELARDGDYDAWDCLNALYGGVPHLYSQGSAANSWAWIEFDTRVLRIDQLRDDYSGLPHVVKVEGSSYACVCECQYMNDTCLDIDGGVFTFVGYVQTGVCDTVWFRSTSQPDGGRALELRDGGIPLDWLMQAPACVHRLMLLRNFDAGF